MSGAWRKRWVVLDEAARTLVYSKDQHTPQLGSISLDGSTLFPSAAAQNEVDGKAGRFQFSIQVNAGGSGEAGSVMCEAMGRACLVHSSRTRLRAHFSSLTQA